MTSLPRRWLLLLSAVLWFIPGVILLRLSFRWAAPHDAGLLLVGLPVLLLFIGLSYALGFQRVVRGNIERIEQLPEHPPLWRVASVRGYVMIVLMIGLGAALRSSDLPKIWLAGPYAVMGGCLLVGALQTGRRFVVRD